MIPDCNNERLTFSIISVAVSDATHRTLITANQLGAVEQIGPPAFSPDGSRIAFSAWSGDGMDSNVFVMDPDGRNLVQLVAGSFPQWSPDGEWLLFSKPHADLFLDLDTWIIGADGKNLRHIGVFAGGAW
jgi:Tol biopolymer transport system component